MSNQPSGWDQPNPDQQPGGTPEQNAWGTPSDAKPDQPSQPYGQQPGYGQPTGQPGYGAPGAGTYATNYPSQATLGAPLGASNPDDLSLPLYGATFGQAVKRFFKKYATFTGRASRSEYWWVALFAVLVQIVPVLLIIIGAAVGFGNVKTQQTGYDSYNNPTFEVSGDVNHGGVAIMVIGIVLAALLWLAMIVPSIAVAWRRLHDGNFPGPLWFIGLTSIGGIVLFVLYLMPSKVEGARFDVRPAGYGY